MSAKMPKMPKNARQLVRKLYKIDRLIVKLSLRNGDFTESHAESMRLSRQAIRRIKNNPGRYNAALGKSCR